MELEKLVEMLKSNIRDQSVFDVKRIFQPGECWVLAEWRRLSTPEWRSHLRSSVASGDQEQEEYARWMLLEILLDPEYSRENLN